MSKIFVKLNKIPAHFASDLLSFRYIGRIDVVHKQQAALVAETDHFVRSYMPAARFNNKNFTFKRFLDESVEVPTIRIYNIENKLVETVETSNLDREQIKQRLLLVEAKLGERLEKDRQTAN